MVDRALTVSASPAVRARTSFTDFTDSGTFNAPTYPATPCTITMCRRRSVDRFTDKEGIRHEVESEEDSVTTTYPQTINYNRGVGNRVSLIDNLNVGGEKRESSDCPAPVGCSIM